MPQGICGSHRMTFGNQFSSSLYGPRVDTQVVAYPLSHLTRPGSLFFLIKTFRSAEEARGVTMASANANALFFCTSLLPLPPPPAGSLSSPSYFLFCFPSTRVSLLSLFSTSPRVSSSPYDYLSSFVTYTHMQTHM